MLLDTSVISILETMDDNLSWNVVAISLSFQESNIFEVLTRVCIDGNISSQFCLLIAVVLLRFACASSKAIEV